MPVYAFQCTNEHEWEGYLPLFDSPNPVCASCGGSSERVWRGRNHRAASVFPYVTTNLHPDGKPVEVKSASHLERLCKEFGVVHRPDVGWLTKEDMGLDFRTGKRVYKESSGVGLPGCWV